MRCHCNEIEFLRTEVELWKGEASDWKKKAEAAEAKLAKIEAVVKSWRDFDAPITDEHEELAANTLDACADEIREVLDA